MERLRSQTRAVTNLGYMLLGLCKKLSMDPSKYDFMLFIFEDIYSHSTSRLLSRVLQRKQKQSNTKVEIHLRVSKSLQAEKKDEAIKYWSNFLPRTLEQHSGYFGGEEIILLILFYLFILNLLNSCNFCFPLGWSSNS
ncbi:MAG: hypothetical protein IPG99_02570 [Ignavibacteria bacterium]|nr:hypothetical protein [Ignavibacteria bacterium]